jgi:transcriptional regulator with XRE-family HTH domain
MSSLQDAGRRLRADRERHRLSTRDVERLSQVVAGDKGNREYALSHAWLTDIENGRFLPSIYKLYTLALVYGRPYDEIVGYFQIDIAQMGQTRRSLKWPRTHLVGPAIDKVLPTCEIPVEFREKVVFEQTQLVSQMFQRWGDVPVGLLQNMDLRNSLYGYIGTEDYTLDPLVRPGSLVRIDPRQRKVARSGWNNEFDRPIYFVELREGYVCSWCDLNDAELTLIPSPRSGVGTRHVRHPGDAEIVGRVTGITMPIA